MSYTYLLEIAVVTATFIGTFFVAPEIVPLSRVITVYRFCCLDSLSDLSNDLVGIGDII